MKKFLKGCGWVLLALACSFLIGLGSRTPRKDLEERMDSIEQMQEDIQRSLDELKSEANVLSDSHFNDDIAGLKKDIDNLASDIKREREERKNADYSIQEWGNDLAGCVDTMDDEYGGDLFDIYGLQIPEDEIEEHEYSEKTKELLEALGIEIDK